MYVRRWIFLAWALSIWGAWYLSGELFSSLKGLVSLGAYILSPPWPGAIAAVRTAALAAAGAGAVSLALLSSGCAVLRLFGRDPAAPGGPLLGFAAGLPTLAMLIQSLGLAGLADPGLLTVVALALGVSGLLALRKMRIPSLSFSGPLAAVVAVSTAAVFLAALGPAVAWDEVVYHLRVPSLYLMERKVHPIPEIFPSNFPFCGEMIMMLAKNLGGDQAARLMHAITWFVSGMGLARVARLLWGSGSTAWALALFMTIPLGQVIAARAYVEYFMVLAVTGVLLAQLEKGGGGEGWRMPLAGWMAGAILGVKYLGGLTGLLMAIWFLSRQRQRSLSRLSLFFLMGALAYFIWPARNFLWSGNPVYPFIWGGIRWTALDMSGWLKDALALNFNVVSLLTAPWRLLRNTPLDGGISPLLLTGVALPLLVLKPGRAKALWSLTGLMFVLLQWSSLRPRYILPVTVLLAILVAGYLMELDIRGQGRSWLRRLALIALWTGVLCGIWESHLGSKPYYVSLGKVSESEFLTGYFGAEDYRGVMDELNRAVPCGRRAYLMGYLHSYGVKHRTWFDFFYTRPSLYWWLAGVGDSGRIAVRARQAGLTHIAYQREIADVIFKPDGKKVEWTQEKLAAYRKFWARHVKESARIKGWIIYEIVPRPGQHPLPKHLPGTQELMGAGFSEALRPGR